MWLSVQCTGPLWESRGFTGDKTRSVPSVTFSPSYSYTIHTVSPPRPLIPVSRGGVQTWKQTSRQVASLLIRCLTHWAWLSISHLQNFSPAISMRLQNTLQGETLILRVMCKCMSLNKQEELPGWFHIWHHWSWKTGEDWNNDPCFDFAAKSAFHNVMLLTHLTQTYKPLVVATWKLTCPQCLQIHTLLVNTEFKSNPPYL